MDTLRSRQEDVKVFDAKLYVHLPADHGPVSSANNANQTILDIESDEIVYYGDEAWVYLYYVTIDKHTGVGSLIQTEATRVKLLANRGGWIDIDMREVLDVWRKYPNENHGLHIVVKTKTGAELPVGVQHQTTNVRTKWVFTLFTKEVISIILFSRNILTSTTNYRYHSCK